MRFLRRAQNFLVAEEFGSAARSPCCVRHFSAAANSISDCASGSGRADPLSLCARRWKPSAPMRTMRVREVTIGAAMEYGIWIGDLALWRGLFKGRVANLLFRGKVSSA